MSDYVTMKIGVIEDEMLAKQRNDYKVRFSSKEDKMIIC